MKKILQISNKAPYPPNDGSSIAIYNMALGLCENNAELHLLTINTKKHFKDDSAVPAEFKAKTHYQSVYRNTDTSAAGALINLFSNQSYFISRFYFKEFEEKLIDKLRQIQFDIIQLEGLFMATFIPAIRKNSKAKIVLRAHNIEYLIWERHIKIEKNPLKKQYLKLQNNRLKRFELDTFKDVDAIVTITDADKAFIEKLNIKTLLYTCITGVDLNEYQTIKNATKLENTLFCFGSMDWMPNQEAVEWFLKNCWNNILQSFPNCQFIIAGRNMPEKFKTLNLPNVKVIENVPDNKEFYCKYDIMLVPLLSGSGLRIKLIEGMSFGKAIVSTSIGAEGIAVTNNKEMMLADSPEDFIKAIELLLNDKFKKSALENEAKEFAKQHFENKTITKKLVEFYEKL